MKPLRKTWLAPAALAVVVSVAGCGGGNSNTASMPTQTYAVTATFYEPETQADNTVFAGTFTFNPNDRTVSNLTGTLTESMSGTPMTTVALGYQLSSTSDGKGGTLVSAFHLNSTEVFAGGGFAAASGPTTYGNGNAYVTLDINVGNTVTGPSAAQLTLISYADCTSGGMMGTACMTGKSGGGSMGGYPLLEALGETSSTLATYSITATFYEPQTQPDNTVFMGTFQLDSGTGTVSGLSGVLTEAMTGTPMKTVPLTYQLSSLSDGSGGQLVSAFHLNSTDVFSSGGFAAASGPTTYGNGNAYITLDINVSSPLAAPTSAQLARTSYADCTAGGMMGTACMTGLAGGGSMGATPMAETVMEIAPAL